MNPNINQENYVDVLQNPERVDSTAAQNEQNQVYKEELTASQVRNQQLGKIPMNVPQINVLPQQQAQIDPVQQVKSMISSGYTPSLALLQNAATLVKNNNQDWADTWFAILLQKLIRQKQNDR